jgi:hypothetical protein
MAATSIFTVADDSALLLHKHFTGADVPAAFEESEYGCRVYIDDDSPLAGTLDDSWTTGKYLGYTHSRRPGVGKVFRFSYVLTGVTYVINVPQSDIKMTELINVNEGL